MKKFLTSFFFLLVLAVSGCSAQPRYVVAYGPPPPQIVRYGPAPGPSFVWVDGYYNWSGRGYVWAPGYWAHPPRHRTVWVSGYWARRHNGYVWVAGYWR